MGVNQKYIGTVALGDTARIDRRNTILAQLEAALLARAQAGDARIGADPYNKGTEKRTDGVWRGRTR